MLDCEQFEGEKVTVLGAVALEYENQIICPTKEFLKADTVNCLWLTTGSRWSEEELGKVSKKIESGDYLVVDGTVSCSNRGHGGLYGAGLEQITFILHDERSEVLWDADGP